MSQIPDEKIIEKLFERISADLGMIIDHELEFEEVATERVTTRLAGEGQIHISFKVVFDAGGEQRYGCFLVPLPEAISMAGYLMMAPDDEVEMSREQTELDSTTKDAMLEVSNFVGGAVDAIVRELCPEDHSARSAGCQGVRADVRPAFPYTEGEELVLGRAKARLNEFPEFDVLLMIPPVTADLAA